MAITSEPSTMPIKPVSPATHAAMQRSAQAGTPPRNASARPPTVPGTPQERTLLMLRRDARTAQPTLTTVPLDAEMLGTLFDARA